MILTGDPSEDEMTHAQRQYIEHLLDTRNVSRLMASKIIAELVGVPERGASGLETLDERRELPNT